MGCVHRRVSPTRQKLDQLLPQFTEIYDEIKKMMSYRTKTIELMNSVADKLDEKHKDVNIAKLVGSATGVVGAVVTGAGIVLTPVTLGAGAVVAVGGGAIMAAGTATAAHMWSRKLWRRTILTKFRGP